MLETIINAILGLFGLYLAHKSDEAEEAGAAKEDARIEVQSAKVATDESSNQSQAHSLTDDELDSRITQFLRDVSPK